MEIAGGNRNRHLKYFKLAFPDKKLPDYCSRCICSHEISENCYITNGNDFIVCGNCCIKKYIDSSGRTCEKCGKNHQRRNINICFKCENVEKNNRKKKVLYVWRKLFAKSKRSLWGL